MLGYGLAIAAALALWWASTGIILYLDGLPRSTFRWSLLATTALAVAGVAGIAMVRDDTSAYGAYVGFASGLAVWAWQTMTFYTGAITGPRRSPCPPGARGWRRFVFAAQTMISHELAIVAGALLLFAICIDSPNQVGLWTYIVLWWMHLSGKLNVFFGVPNLSEEFLPDHLGYLRSYMRREPMNLLFPISVTVSTLVTAEFAYLAAAQHPSSFAGISNTLLATLMALAILEHWLLVLPLPAMALWTWSLKSRQSTAHGDAAQPPAAVRTGPDSRTSEQSFVALETMRPRLATD